MKLTAQEEYGLRCLLQLARRGEGGSLTIPEISRAEGISGPYVAKLMRILRRGRFVKSVRGQAGGYMLARPADQISVGEVLAALGGRLYEPDFCDRHTGVEKTCNHSSDCAVRSLWSAIQRAVDQVAGQVKLKDLISDERPAAIRVSSPVKLMAARVEPAEGCAGSSEAV
ncbi:MAG TPA: Rrf2 family transcriptional regulator [Blastocatellia bacterium]|nr:Rrf2 family transcriptional regulator [Blastocatellia bacterium]